MLFNVVYYTTYKKQENMNYHFTFAVKWSIYYVTIITMGIFSQVKIWHVTYVFSYVKISHFTWKLTFFSCGVYIRNVHNIYWFQVYKMSFLSSWWKYWTVSCPSEKEKGISVLQGTDYSWTSCCDHPSHKH